MEERFNQLNSLLIKYRHLWQLEPFQLCDYPEHWPLPLIEALEQLEQPELDNLDSDRQREKSLFAPFIDDLDALITLCQISPTSKRPLPELSARFSAGIKGRKWQQIIDFCSSIPSGDTYLEWCAGKGHLGKALAKIDNAEVQSVEWQLDLCVQGQEKANKEGLKIHFTHADVLKGEADALIQSHQHSVALHACGELHLSLLRKASAKGTQNISIAPCCYHLIPNDIYCPLSEAAQGSALRLSKHDLKLAVQQSVTSGDRSRRLRHKEMIWRLGFDELQKLVNQSSEYLPLPSFPKQLLSQNFQKFCQWATQEKSLMLPTSIDFDSFEKKGAKRYAMVQRIDSVRHVFRRAIEVWLILDRCLFLREKGYEVNLGLFCKFEDSPRNALITATKR